MTGKKYLVNVILREVSVFSRWLCSGWKATWILSRIDWQINRWKSWLSSTGRVHVKGTISMAVPIAHRTDSIRIYFYPEFDIKQMKVRFHQLSALVLYSLILWKVKYYSDKVLLERSARYKSNRSTKLRMLDRFDSVFRIFEMNIYAS